MSRLLIKGPLGQRFVMNVLQFRAPMSAQIDSAQTKDMLQHFPIRAGQPDIQFTVKFASLDEKTRFEAFVRKHQVAAHNDGDKKIHLMWPQRNIINWSGFICEYKVAVRRFDYAPQVTFGVALVDSMLSRLTIVSSVGTPFSRVYGPQVPDIITPLLDGLLQLPSMFAPPSNRTNTPGGGT